jgi:phosphotransferase system enzyme I (PtsI)
MKTLTGIAASPGIAIGPARVYRATDPPLPPRAPGGIEDEWARFERALAAAGEELTELQRNAAERAGSHEASIFMAHQMMIQDPLLAGGVRDRLSKGATAEQAVSEVARQIADQLAAMTDPLFAARAADVRDVGRRVVRILLGHPATSLDDLRAPSIIVADDLTPSDTVSLNPNMTLGFCTAAGGVTSHTAILARTLGLPAVVALGETLLDSIADGDKVILDGGEGLVRVTPSAQRLAEAREQQKDQQRQAHAWAAASRHEARTADGRRVEVAANVGDRTSAGQAAASGAEGIGLFRTEFLFLEVARPPSEDLQREAYAAVFGTMRGKPIIVRTLDVGGDKPPSFLSFPRELNPFLGWRAIRISLERTDLFLTQVRAILQAAPGHDVRIMLPMISRLEEVQRARALVLQAEADLEREGKAHATDLPIGIMVETPAAALLVDVLASSADFFSLGTNDLTQYVLAVDRGNARVAKLFEPLHPAVLRLIRLAIDSAHRSGKWIGMCGELAGNPRALPILVGLGLDEASMVPAAIPQAKALIARLDSARANRLADEVLTLRTSAEVEVRVDEFFSEIGWTAR